MKKLLIATHNKHKLQEFRLVLEPLGIQIVGSDEMNIPDCDETGTTFQENSFQKALWGMEHCQLPTIADDSGLCIHALNDEPGLFSARFAKENGGYPNTFKVLFEKLKNQKDWTAHFTCCLCLVIPKKEPQFFVGNVSGHLTTKPDSSLSDFGYDPIFVPDGFDKPFGALPADTKKNLSHRGRALELLIAYLKDNPLE
ncbi:MAG: RdgB/HAM1 family non-canonical purine NTP pyrophosphatase [Alphaproteobacteria bacterium]|nr:RdgB/HAM1 family non-canonical purine NTP pyrophosphatase [Alphaproteobacteria bacterium]